MGWNLGMGTRLPWERGLQAELGLSEEGKESRMEGSGTGLELGREMLIVWL